MSKNELICLYAATVFSREELVKLLKRQSVKLQSNKVNNHIHRYATPHRNAKKDRRLKMHHTINCRLQLTWAYQRQIEGKQCYDLLDLTTGMYISKKNLYNYLHCYETKGIDVGKDGKNTKCYHFVGNKRELEKHFFDKSLDKHFEAVYICNILKNIGGKRDDKKRINRNYQDRNGVAYNGGSRSNC
ncbi:MAG: hypothetical protein ACRCX2_27975 [Paraclostridium sp.]